MTHSKLKIRRMLQQASLAMTLALSGSAYASEGELRQVLPQVDHAKWRTECGRCHILFHPALLPERSWRKIMGGLDQHFGKSLELNGAAQQEITEFLAAHAAEHSTDKRAKSIAKSAQTGQVPLRISETAYFKLHHNEIASDVWLRQAVGSKTNCAACHPNAGRNDFNEHEIRIPR